ncbi:thiamine pyrophosphate-dependent enzyme [Ruegeria sp.]|uniref:thiamine pyrophosphate-dependent enzyme n=1 Tax=Ruegeria sp. TaxID=1879320 RepID=UPI00230FF4F1|nr:thiamine pyrophosphate-dependent enzyme [Ruegeria sp.]MDA7965561.1 thiamine pyrophosphate-dependent enzyme [Ruegeria sp.]
MNVQPAKIRAADHLVDLLITQGVDRIFGVPGESYLPVLDALYERQNSVEFVTFRQEGGAAMAADAYGKLTGRPGICFVTRAPGATNASAGVHVAFQDSTPMILFIGQIARDTRDREAFQEVDYRRMFGQMAKWVAEIDDPSRLQEYISRAFRTALSGRPGPVVLALPEDMLYEEIIAPQAPRAVQPPRFAPAPEQLAQLKDKLAQAQRPLILAGGGGWTQGGMDALTRFAEQQGLPVAVSFRSQGVINNNHPNYVGHFSLGKTPYLIDAVKECDLLLAIGPRLGEMTTSGYQLLQPPVPETELYHVYPQAEEIGRVFEPAMSLVSDLESFCSAVAEWEPLAPDRFQPGTTALRQQFETFTDAARLGDDDILSDVFAHLSDVLPPDAIMTNGAGNYSGWLHRFYRYRAQGSQLAPTSGSMGYGLPAAVAAASATPEREVYCFAGDGCFMMTSQELATAMHHNLSLTVMIINNNRYGTIRAHQEREFPARISGTQLSNPDFCAYAKSFGASTWRVECLDGFKDALKEARAQHGIKVIEFTLDPEILSPGVRLQAS